MLTFSPKIYVIAQSGAPIRNPSLLSQANELGLAAERVSLRPSELPSIRKVDRQWQIILQGHPLSPGEVRCALTHRLAHVALCESEAPWAMICEDDASLNDVALRASESWIVLLNRFLVKPGPRFVSLYGPESATDGNSFQLAEVRQAGARLPAGAVCYALNRELAERTVFRDPMVTTADWPLHFAASRFAVFHPSVATEVSSESRIGSRSASVGRLRRARLLMRRILTPPGSSGNWPSSVSVVTKYLITRSLRK